MSAGTTLQAAIVQATQSLPALTGVYDGPPARAAYPYLVVDASTEVDWSHKTGAGREVPVALTVWDNQPARLQDLAEQIEHQISGLEVAGMWRLISIGFVRKRVLRDVAGPWAAALDFRARLLLES